MSPLNQKHDFLSGNSESLETYFFHEGPLSAKITVGFETAIFNTAQYRLLQDPLHWVSFFLINSRESRAVAGISFHTQDGVASSPLRAPFGSLECSDDIDGKLLYRFLETVGDRLKEHGISEVLMKSAPEIYFPGRSAMLEVFLLNQQYIVSDAELAAIINVDSRAFTDVIRNSERLRLQQAKNANLIFRRLALNDLSEIYQFLSHWHGVKGYKISITHDDLKKTALEFADRYIPFGVFYGKEMIAASIGIQVYRNVLYNFWINHNKAYDGLSPALLLMEGMYDFCKSHEIAWFDLGTSALQGKPNFPLLDFKLHLGATLSPKLTFYKKSG